ncbi:MAG: DUF5309 family protein [Pseudomonadota bacterium]
MAAPTNTLVQASTVGIREDLEDDIYRVAAEETPFTNNIGKMRIKGTLHEYQTEDLATPDPTNAHLEGDDVASLDAPHTTVRISMRPQIFRKTGGVSRTNQISDRAGREDSLDEQKMIKGIECRRDMEARFIGNYASNAESGATPRRTAGALAWIEDHDSLGASGASGGWSSGDVAAATPGTARAFAESQVKAILATAFSNGARMSQAYLGPTHKQEFSAFSGIAETRVNTSKAKQTKIIGAADVYVSDFGNITLIPHPYGLGSDALLIDPSGWCVGTYDGVKTEPLAKTGDSDKFLMTTEKGIICKNQRKGAVIRALS